MGKEVPIHAKPMGQEGEELLDTMDKGHTPIALWSYTNMEIGEDDVLVDIGCGSGLNVKRLHQKSCKAKSYGVDYSSTCVKKATKLNQELVDKGCVEVLEADVQKLPFDDDSIDVATAFSTIFFWPNIVNCFREIKRVLKPGGKLYMVQGLNGLYDDSLMEDERNDGCNFFNDEQLKNMLLEAGYSSTTAFIRQRMDNKKIVRTCTPDGCSEELFDDFYEENIENEQEPISPEWLCMLGVK